MFEDISNLGSSDPKVGKAAALSIVQHVSEVSLYKVFLNSDFCNLFNLFKCYILYFPCRTKQS